jgi:thiamine-phosphate pyrophosphorylase
MRFEFPKIYPILDSSFIPTTGRAEFLDRLGRGLAEAGIRLLEYRNKNGAKAEIVADAAVLRQALPAGKVKLILDDRVDLVETIGFDGAHVDDGDLSPTEARKLLGPDKIIGTFAGNLTLIPGILEQPADYFAVGPVWDTVTKKTTLPSIGPEGVRHLRQIVGPSVTITAAGGIKLEKAPEVLAAGATAVSVVGGIFRTPDPVAEFRRWAETLNY